MKVAHVRTSSGTSRERGRTARSGTPDMKLHLREVLGSLRVSLAVMCVLTALCSSSIPVLAQSAPIATTRKSKEFRRALPGYVFQFPQDHRSHNEFKTEWWYYTGHLETPQKKPFGFELTFFRSGLDTSKQVQTSRWKVDNVYLAHFAVSDLAEKKFLFHSQTNRPGVATAGADQQKYQVWNGGWSATLDGNTHALKASQPDYAIDLKLTSAKPPAVHGKNGVSQKANCVGCASHYYSMTRMLAKGTIRRGAKTLPVEGTVWMDHEFGSNQLTKEQIGWDWFSIQLEDNSEIMLYVMRLKSGQFDPNSSGTIISADGKTEHLSLTDYKIDVEKHWKSSATKANYPAGWHVVIPGRQLDITIEPLLDNQELIGDQTSGISYWEGACKATGTANGKNISGQAYVELTGYAGDFTSNI